MSSSDTRLRNLPPIVGTPAGQFVGTFHYAMRNTSLLSAQMDRMAVLAFQMVSELFVRQPNTEPQQLVFGHYGQHGTKKACPQG